MRLKKKNTILKEAYKTSHEVGRIKSRFSVLAPTDLDDTDKFNIIKNLNLLDTIKFEPTKSYGIKLGGFKINPQSKYYLKIGDREYYRINNELLKDSTGNEFWVIVRNDRVTTFMLRKDIQSRDEGNLIEKLRVDKIIFDLNTFSDGVKLIDEDFESQNNIGNLAIDVVKAHINYFINEILNNGGKSPNSVISNPFKGLKGDYGVMNDFVGGFNLAFRFISIPSLGQFNSFDGKSGGIILNIPHDTIFNMYKKMVTKYDDRGIVESKIYSLLTSSNLLTVLKHELQHAYDNFISDGKYVSDKSSKKYYSNVENLKDDGKTSAFTNYLKLKHEINARFTQTIDEIPLDDSSEPNNFITLKNYLANFKSYFVGWDKISDKDRKYLYRRASQYYYKFKEKENKDSYDGI